jgi:hypothetical protein
MFKLLTTLLFSLIFIGLWPMTVFAQAVIVSGVVRSTDDEPITDATVSAQMMPSDLAADQTAQTKTNRSGRFALLGLRSGRWIFSVQKAGFETVQSPVNVRLTGRVNISFVMKFDIFNPPAPATGVLAGIRSIEIQENLLMAHESFDQGNFDDAIAAYKSLLELVPKLTGLNLQLGHAYRENRNYRRALEAYQTIPDDSPAAQNAEAAIATLRRENLIC